MVLTEEEYLQMSKIYGQPIAEYVSGYAETMDFATNFENDSNKVFKKEHSASNEEKAYMANIIKSVKTKDKQVKRYHLERMKSEMKQGKEITMPPTDSNIPVAHLALGMAESYQESRSSQGHVSEYYTWIQEHADIVGAMKRDGATDPEIHARDVFVLFLEDREAEMKVLESMYVTALNGCQGYYKEVAAHRLRFLHFKISEMRRLRDNAKNVSYTRAEELEQQKEQRRKLNEKVMERVVNATMNLSMQQQRYMDNSVADNEFGSALSGVMTQYRPVTASLKEVGDKKLQLYSNNEKMNDCIRVMQLRGITPKGDSLQNDAREGIRKRIYRPRGFNSYAFQENRLSNSMSA